MSTNSPISRTLSSQWRMILTITTFLALAILIYAVRKQIADVFNNFGKVNTWALLLIIPLQIINYDAYTRLYRRLLGILGHKTDYWPMYRITLETNFVNHILPSGGVSGIGYFGVRARGLGVSAAKSALVQLMKFVLLFVAFQPLLVVGLLLLAARGHVNDLIMVVASSLITLLIVGTLTVAYIIESRSRINAFLTLATRILNRIIRLVRPSHPETISIKKAQAAFDELHDNYLILKGNLGALKMPLLFCLIANITEIATVYTVYIAFGSLVNVGAVILAYAVANFAGLISVLPAGIGIYEGLMTAVLAATGIKPELSIPVTVMYRILSMVIQLVPGYILYQRTLRVTGRRSEE